jgi:hypothetical protein
MHLNRKSWLNAQKKPLDEGLFSYHVCLLFLPLRDRSLALFRYEIRIFFILFALLQLPLVLLVYMLVVSSSFVIRRHRIFLVPRIHLSPSQVYRLEVQEACLHFRYPQISAAFALPLAEVDSPV